MESLFEQCKAYVAENYHYSLSRILVTKISKLIKTEIGEVLLPEYNKQKIKICLHGVDHIIIYIYCIPKYTDDDFWHYRIKDIQSLLVSAGIFCTSVYPIGEPEPMDQLMVCAYSNDPDKFIDADYLWKSFKTIDV